MAIRRAKESFSFTDSKGAPQIVTAGQLVNTDTMDGYSGREHLFEDVETTVAREEENRKFVETGKRETPVETATASPGEKRRFQPPTRKEGQ